MQHTDMEWPQWQGYWREMTAFRNRFVAHRELDFEQPVPSFDLALAVAFYYDRWIRMVIWPDHFDEPSLEESAIKLGRTVGPLVSRLLQETSKYDQRSERQT